MTTDGIILVMKVALCANAYGQCSIDTESLAVRLANALDLPKAMISCGHRELTVSFGGGPIHALSTIRGFDFAYLRSISNVASAVIAGEIATAAVGLRVLRVILARPAPYGWAMNYFATWAIGPWAAMTVYDGSYHDMLGAAW